VKSAEKRVGIFLPVKSPEFPSPCIAASMREVEHTGDSFRHTHATLLGDVGESLRTASAILGHSNLGTTVIYVQAIPESQKRAVNKVAEILFPSVPKFRFYRCGKWKNELIDV
jgi:integrase